ncbi:MAG: 50S ribosomal protein L21 [Candidatus Limnocylindrales bacterium]
MYAVIETGGKQYRVEVGTEIEVERLDAEPGQTLELERVLLVADGDTTAVGRPIVDGAHVSARVLRQDRGDKVVVFKYRPKARSRVKHGHRQELTVLRVADIIHGSRSALQLAEAAKSERQRLEEAAASEAAERAAADRVLAEKLAGTGSLRESAGATAAESGAGSESAALGASHTPASPAKSAPRPRIRAPRTQAPAPGGEAKPRSRGPRKDA